MTFASHTRDVNVVVLMGLQNMENHNENIAPDYSHPEWQSIEDEFDRRKADVANVFVSATSVEAFYFKIGKWPPDKPLGNVRGIPFYKMGITQDHVFASRLERLVLDAKSYLCPGGSIKLCIFEPTVGFRVKSEVAFVDVIICFSCLQLIAVDSGSTASVGTTGLDAGWFTVAGDVDLIAGALADLSRECFPEI